MSENTGVSVGEQPGRILVVDDNEMNRDILTRRLQRQGFETATAIHGRQALDMLKETPFDVVLLDVMMPEMDGYETLQRMQEDDDLRDVRVIMISALDAVESVVKCVGLGADDYLTKPFNPILLRARLDSSLARKRLHDQELDHARSMERELDIGREIQSGFLPRELPNTPGWEMAAHFQAARQVAGDFYDVFPLGAHGTLGLVVADVCDKGVGAALFMALFRTLLRATASQLAEDGMTPGDAVLRAVHVTNDYISGTHGDSYMFATTFIAALDPSSGELTYVNCGHEPPAIVGGAELVRLEPTGPALGMLPDITFEKATAFIHTGETLVGFTDGITEARDSDEVFFGDEKLFAAFNDPVDSAAGLVARIIGDVTAHTAGTPQTDDITLLAVRKAS